MAKVYLSVFAIVLVFIRASQGNTLEWPSNLVGLSSSKSTQLLPIAEEDGTKLATGSSSSATASVETEGDLSQSQSSTISTDASDSPVTSLSGLLSPVPVSVPLPLILAARSGLRTVLTIQEPTVTKVGEVVQHVPTAISHQSQTVVHDHRRLITPIVAPALRTTEVIRQQPPLVWTVAASPDPRVLLLRN